MVAVRRNEPAQAVIELGAFRGVYTIDGRDSIEWIELAAHDLIGRGRHLWIVPSRGGRKVAGAQGRGSGFWSAIFAALHGRPVTETRLIRTGHIPRNVKTSARKIGELLNIYYQPRRSDRTFKRNRRHVFKSPRPELLSTGAGLFVVGGDFRVTQFGIVG